MKKWLALLTGIALLFTFCFSAFAEDAADDDAEDAVAEDAATDEEADEEIDEESDKDSDKSEKTWAEEINPHGYKLLHITDVFTPDPETDEENNPVEGESLPVVQGSFGDIDMTDESDPQFIGFEKEAEGDEDEESNDSYDGETFTLGLAPDCELLLPTDFENPTENSKVDIKDFEAWAAKLSEVKGGIDFYATFEMDDDANITKLEYFWTPWD